MKVTKYSMAKALVLSVRKETEDTEKIIHKVCRYYDLRSIEIAYNQYYIFEDVERFIDNAL